MYFAIKYPATCNNKPIEAKCAYAVINFNTAKQTCRCIESLLSCDKPPDKIYVLDNASKETDFKYLCENLKSGTTTDVYLYRSAENTGFARGSNLIINEILKNQETYYVGLLNSDAVAEKEMISLLLNEFGKDADVSMVGGRMHKLFAPDIVDTLGISIYKSLMPADRHETTDIFIGPTGGCAMFKRSFLEEINATTGYIFDERYFCYCEDTDLVLRARLLGHTSAYIDQLIAFHEGQASTAATNSSFIAYMGLRNTIWMHAKLVPRIYLACYLPWLVTAHLGTIARYCASGRASLILKIWKDVFKSLPAFLNENKIISNLPNYNNKIFPTLITSRFYRKGYISTTLLNRKK